VLLEELEEISRRVCGRSVIETRLENSAELELVLAELVDVLSQERVELEREPETLHRIERELAPLELELKRCVSLELGPRRLAPRELSRGPLALALALARLAPLACLGCALDVVGATERSLIELGELLEHGRAVDRPAFPWLGLCSLHPKSCGPPFLSFSCCAHSAAS